MSAAGLFRTRKRLLSMLVEKADSPYDNGWNDALEEAISSIDEELEQMAKDEYLRPINPDPVTAMAKSGVTK